MKKTISILLALTMLFALCVPSFAVNKTITDSSLNPQTGEIVVDGTATGTENYTVEFDATTNLTWGITTAQNVAYSYKCQLKPGNHLHITVTNDTKNTLKAVPTSSTDTISYKLAGDVDVTSKSANVSTLKPQNATVTVTAENWSKAPLGQYKDTLTFTVTVVSAA